MASHGTLQVVCAETSRRSSSTVTKKRAGAPPLPPIDDEVVLRSGLSVSLQVQVLWVSPALCTLSHLAMGLCRSRCSG